ncbi:unnamed protein product, partial [Vitis vinifera]
MRNIFFLSFVLSGTNISQPLTLLLTTFLILRLYMLVTSTTSLLILTLLPLLY